MPYCRWMLIAFNMSVDSVQCNSLLFHIQKENEYCRDRCNVKESKVSYGSWSDSIRRFFKSRDGAISRKPRSYLEQVINDAMATADNIHVLSYPGIMKIRKELQRKDTSLLKKEKNIYVVLYQAPYI
jgi:hypothetical protein